MLSEIDPALSIGAILGDSDSESMAWSRQINALSRKVQNARQDITSPLRVNVVFHVDGKLAPNEFVGIRTGSFSKKRSMLMIQVAITLDQVDDIPKYLRRLLEASIVESEIFARKRKLADGLPELLTLVKDLDQKP
ncbi:hypothetical protein [Arthrobacter sp. HLT1-20]